MQRVLRKRILRDLRSNWLRYLALSLLLILCMYLVVSIVGAADTLIEGSARHGEENGLEDGQFTLFLPLTGEEKAAIEARGVVLEKTFFLDYALEDGSVLRVFRLRETLDRVELEAGELPASDGEVVLERRYCEEKALSVGDDIQISGRSFRVCGIGTTPDYDAPFRKMGDTAVDSKTFGTAFVTEEAYTALAESGESLQSEEFVYAYRLGGSMTEEELKEHLKDLDFDPYHVEDRYFREYWEETAGKRDELLDGTVELADGARELYDALAETAGDFSMEKLEQLRLEVFPDSIAEGMEELNNGGRDLADGAETLRESAEQLYIALAAAGEQIRSSLSLLTDQGDNGELMNQAQVLIDSSSALAQGMSELAGGARQLYESLSEAAGLGGMLGSVLSSPLSELTESGGQLLQGAERLSGSAEQLYEALAAMSRQMGSGGLSSIQDMTEELSSQTQALIDGSGALARGAAELASGAKELRDALGEAAGQFDRENLAKLREEVFPDELAEGLGELRDGSQELADGTEELRDAVETLSDEYLQFDVTNLISFVPAEDNPRVGAAADDQAINKYGGLVAGVIILILFTYVISVFVVHSIEEESSIIGTLYALGIRRKELLRHYLLLPVLVTLVSGAVGTALGLSSLGVPTQTADCYSYFSLPTIATIVKPYLILYGVVIPPVVAALVNWLVIRRKLAAPALKLIRREQKQVAAREIDLKNMGFIGRFRVRQMMREGRSAVTVWFGMLVTLLLLMLAMNAYVMCDHVRADNAEDTRYGVMYLYKYPQEEIPEGAYPAYAETLKKEVLGFDLDVTVLGITEDNPYFDAHPPESMRRVEISSAMAEKYGLREGDPLVLTDEQQDRDYAFEVERIVKYAPSFFVFMDIDQMRKLFHQAEDYHNMLFSDTPLDIPAGRLQSVTAREDVVQAAEVFVELMGPMVYTMLTCSALIFTVVMYLMMKVMIDRSAHSISLLKIFGYRRGEIRKLYLNGNFYLVALGAAVCIPLSKWIMDAMYPVLVSNVACGMNLTFPWQMYGLIYLGILALYLLINLLLVRRIDRISPVEILKDRE